MNELDALLQDYMRRKPVPEQYATPEEYDAARARYVAKLKQVADKYKLTLTDMLPPGTTWDSEHPGQILRVRKGD